MFTYRNLMTVCAAAVLAFGLAACGSSDDDTAEAPAVEMPEPMPMPMPMPMYAHLGLADADNTLTSTSGLDEVDDSEMINIAAGESVVRGGVLFSCAGGRRCLHLVMIQNEAGTAVAWLHDGGMPTATQAVPTAPIALPSGHDLAPGTVMIPAGGSYTVGTTVVSCPAGGMACTVTVSQAPLGGPIVGSSSGGTATVALAPSPTWTRHAMTAKTTWIWRRKCSAGDGAVPVDGDRCDAAP